MDTMNIALPASMKHFVQERVSEGGYSSVSEYMRELIRADQKRKAEERIDALLLEGLDSGRPLPVTPEYRGGEKRKRAAAEAVLELGFTGADKGRMASLSAKARDGTLSHGERAEIEKYEKSGHKLALMKSKARRSLKGQGPTDGTTAP